MTAMVAGTVRKGARDQRHNGAGLAASGAVLGGTGLIAGGVPGVREPKGLEVFNVRGSMKRQRAAVARGEEFSHAELGRDARGDLSPLHRANLRHNAGKVAPLPRAGILGFRASVHQGMIDHIDQHGRMPDEPKPLRGYDKGRLKGVHEAETKVVRGMRTARRASYGLTAGGAGLVALGLHRAKQNSVIKRETRERGAVAGAAGTTAGATGGAYAGLRYGGDVGVGIVNRNIVRQHLAAGGTPPEPRQTLVGADRFVRRMKGVERGVKGGVALGGLTLGAAGYRAARGRKVTTAKRDRFENGSSAALYGGGTLAAVGHGAPVGLKRFSRKYSNSAKHHVLEAQRLVPGLGGLETLPEKRDPHFGRVTKPAKQTMYPAVRGPELARQLDRSKAPSAVKQAAGRHRATATQERHFVEVFDNTARTVRRVRGPGAALAAAGAAGLAGVRGHQAAQQRFRKSFVPIGREIRVAGSKALTPGKKQLAYASAGNEHHVLLRRSPKFTTSRGREIKQSTVLKPNHDGGFVQSKMKLQRWTTPAQGDAVTEHGTGMSSLAQYKYGRSEVGKSVTYGYMENRRNKLRTAELGAGLTLGAYGASRLPIDEHLGRGVRYAQTKGYGEEARNAAQLVRRGRKQVQHGTGKVAEHVRRIPGMGTALEAIPPKMRPGFALASGAVLAARATPTHDERFVPTGRF